MELAIDGNTVKAIRWMLTSDQFLSEQLPKLGPDYALYLWQRALLASTYQSPEQQLKFYQEAFDASSRIDFAPIVKAYILSEIVSNWTGLLILAGRPNDAAEVLKKHPQSAQKDAILSGSARPDLLSLPFSVASIFVDRALGITPDPRWGPFLQAAYEMPDDGPVEKDIKDYIPLAEALMIAGKDPQTARNLTRRAAKQRVANLQEIYAERNGAFPLVTLWDRAIMQLGVNSAVEDQTDDDLIIAAIDILDRSLLSATSDQVAILSQQPDDENRRVAHAWIQLTDQRDSWELSQLKEINSDSPINDPNEETSGRSWRRIMHATFVKEQERLRATSNPTSHSTSLLPSMEDMRATLHPGEAFIRIGFTSNNQIVRYCVSPKEFTATTGTFDPQSLIASQKLLLAAVTLTGGPDPETDRQYPIREAMNIWQAISSGLKSCLRPAKHLIVSLPPSMQGIP